MTRKADNFGLAEAMLISEEVSGPLRSSSRSIAEFYEGSIETSSPVVAKYILISLHASPCAMGLAVPVKYTAFGYSFPITEYCPLYCSLLSGSRLELGDVFVSAFISRTDRLFVLLAC